MDTIGVGNKTNNGPIFGDICWTIKKGMMTYFLGYY